MPAETDHAPAEAEHTNVEADQQQPMPSTDCFMSSSITSLVTYCCFERCVSDVIVAISMQVLLIMVHCVTRRPYIYIKYLCDGVFQLNSDAFVILVYIE